MDKKLGRESFKESTPDPFSYQNDGFTDTGNSIDGTDTLTQTGSHTHSITDSGTANAYAYTVNQNDGGSFALTTSTDSIDQTYTTTETSTNTYSLAENSATSAGSWSLSENGVDGITTIEAGDSANGNYAQTQTGVDSYTITESATLGTGSYSLTLTGTDNPTQTETGNNIQGTFTRTVDGGGTYSRTETGGTMGSFSGANVYTLTVAGNNLTGVYSQSEIGTDRFELIEQFDNIADTGGVVTPGHMQYHPFNTAFEDDAKSPQGMRIEVDAKEQTATLFVNVSIKFVYAERSTGGTWWNNSYRQMNSMIRFVDQVETTFNNNGFRLVSKADPRIELKPRLHINLGIGIKDPAVIVNMRPHAEPKASTTKDGFTQYTQGNEMFLYEMTPTGKQEAATGPYKGSQMTLDIWAHEFGHAIGLQHPGQDLTPPAPLNDEPDYDADPHALMGRGNQMRRQYFQLWVELLSKSQFIGLDGRSHQVADWEIK